MSHDDELNEADLEGYLDEALPLDRMSQIEARVRTDPAVRQQLSLINRRRDAGLHSMGGIWRRYRVSCPSRSALSGYLLGSLAPEEADYIEFHLNVIGCRLCQANLDDLRARAEDQENQAAETDRRRRKYFESSRGLLSKNAE